MSVQPIQDTIDLVLSAEITIVSDTVKMEAHISVTMTADDTEDAINNEIRSTMKKLIDTDWSFSGRSRKMNTSGLETMTLLASARVSEKENYNLEERCKNVSRKGLSVHNMTADLTMPAKLIEDGERKLRLMLIEKARSEQNAISEAMNIGYRINNLTFGQHQNMISNNSRNAGATYAMASEVMKSDNRSGFGDDDTLGNSAKMQMTASLTLATVVPTV